MGRPARWTGEVGVGSWFWGWVGTWGEAVGHMDSRDSPGCVWGVCVIPYREHLVHTETVSFYTIGLYHKCKFPWPLQ